MITPRATRLVRAAGAGAFREALVTLISPQHGEASPGTDADVTDPFAARDRLVLVPTRAAAAHLVRAIELRRVRDAAPVILPDFATAAELPARLAERLDLPAAIDPARREVLLGVACRLTIAEGTVPPFQLRPGLIAEILQFYDALRRHGRDVDTFERLALGMLQPGADSDRGAERLRSEEHTSELQSH